MYRQWCRGDRSCRASTDSGSRSADRGRYYAEALTPKTLEWPGRAPGAFSRSLQVHSWPAPPSSSTLKQIRTSSTTSRVSSPSERGRCTAYSKSAFSRLREVAPEKQLMSSTQILASGWRLSATLERGAARSRLFARSSTRPAFLPRIGWRSTRRKAASGTSWREANYLAARGTALFLLKIDPNKPFYRAKLTEAYLGLDQVDEAVELAEATEASGLADHEAPYLRTASGLFRSGAKTRALRLAERIAAATESADAYYTVGEMYADLGDLEARLGALQQALAASPTHAAARLSLAIHWVQVGDAVQAEQEFSILLREHPLFARAHFNYAVLLLQQKRWLEAGARLERTVQIQPTYWAAHLAQITAYIAQGRRGDAERVREVLESCPGPCRSPGAPLASWKLPDVSRAITRRIVVVGLTLLPSIMLSCGDGSDADRARATWCHCNPPLRRLRPRGPRDPPRANPGATSARASRGRRALSTGRGSVDC